MADTKLHHDSAAPRTSDSNSGLHHPTTNVPAGQKRTRSQFNVSDTILRLPLSRSPLKDARKAHAKAWVTSASLRADPQVHMPGEVAASSSAVVEASLQEGVHEVGREDGLDTSADGQEQKYKDSHATRKQPTMWPASTKKRASPDTDAARTLSGPGSERQSKRTKTDAFRSLGRRQEHSEYHEPLRDPGPSTPGRSKGHKRASSTKPTPSPTKAASSIFPPRAQSVPIGGENEVLVMDLTSVPPSPRRSPSKGAVEIRRAPSVPPPDGDQMDIDADDTSTLLHFTNPTCLDIPQANPVFRYTVNFATPRRSATPSRSDFPAASPLSPLTPLPASPSTECVPEMRSVLAKADAKLRALGGKVDIDIDTPTRTTAIPSASDTITSMDIFQSATRVSTQHLSLAPTSDLAAEASRSSAISQPSFVRPSLTSRNSMESLPPPTASEKDDNLLMSPIVAGDSGQAKGIPSDNPDAAGMSDASSDLSSAPSSQSASNAMPISRPTIIRAMKPKQGFSAPRGQNRITRSVSMKEQKVTARFSETEDTTVTSYTSEVPVTTKTTTVGPSAEVVPVPPPSIRVPAKPRPPKSTGAAASKPNPPLTTRRSTSLSMPLSNPKLRQTSLNTFVKAKLSAIGGAATAGSSTASTSTSTGSTSGIAPTLSPSKIPLPASPLKRTSTGITKSSQFSHGTARNGAVTGAHRGTPGRSLKTLSHALDKLVVPPPSRPNTSMGFTREERTGEEMNTPENGKGKEKAKDDTSLPAPAHSSGSTFARPTASSLKRASTVTGFGSTAAARMRRDGTTGGPGRGRGTIGIFGRAGDRASKKTSLPVVAGSPVKVSRDVGDPGSGKHKTRLSIGTKDAGDTAGEDVFLSLDVAAEDGLEQDVVMQDLSVELLVGGSAASQKLSPLPAANVNHGVDVDLTISPISADKGKQRAVPPSTLNPASAALHALSESLSSLPQTPTPPKPRVAGTRTGLRSSSATVGKDSPALDGSTGSIDVHGSGGAGPHSGTVNGSGGIKKSSLKILKRCAIFVDVRTEQGDDAGSVFVDMLKGLGAKIMGRLGQTCTHLVYKNGHPNTLTRYRLLNDPKPVVVGIAWVVECAEQRARLDEERFKIDVDMINVAGGNNKRRRSMLPKYLIPSSPGPGSEVTMHTSSEADDECDVAIDGSPSQNPDTSIRSREEDDLPPLERARRRRSILPGGQTRLIP